MQIESHVEGDDLVITVDDETIKVPLFLIENWDKYYGHEGDEIPEDEAKPETGIVL